MSNMSIYIKYAVICQLFHLHGMEILCTSPCCPGSIASTICLDKVGNELNPILSYYMQDMQDMHDMQDMQDMQ